MKRKEFSIGELVCIRNQFTLNIPRTARITKRNPNNLGQNIYAVQFDDPDILKHHGIGLTWDNTESLIALFNECYITESIENKQLAIF